MVGRPAGRFGLDPLETELAKIHPLDEHLNRPDGIVFGNVVVQPLGEQRALRSRFTFDEPLHPQPPINRLT